MLLKCACPFNLSLSFIPCIYTYVNQHSEFREAEKYLSLEKSGRKQIGVILGDSVQHLILVQHDFLTYKQGRCEYRGVTASCLSLCGQIFLCLFDSLNPDTFQITEKNNNIGWILLLVLLGIPIPPLRYTASELLTDLWQLPRNILV